MIFLECVISLQMKVKKIKSSWKEYFNFSARERRGVFFLACILIIQIAFLFYLRSITTPIIPPDPGIIKLLLESVDLNDSTNYKPNLQKSILKEKISLFYFDPNSTIEKSWLKLGVNENQIRVIKNYLSKGGRFRIKSDFKKMYCISSEKYTELRPYLLLPDSINKLSPIIKWKKITKNIIVDIESADTSELMTLKGIGPTYAKRIVNYREKLGGFYSIDQVGETYGVPDSTFQKMKQ